jgi:PAS domain S-box-containing protein
VALKSSESQSREAQRIAHLGNWERDLATNQIRASDEFCRIFFGFIPQDRQHAYETVFSLIHPEDQNPVLEVTKRALSDQKPFNVEYRIVRPDSSTRTISVSGEVITDQEGKAIKVRGIAQDITERKRVDDDFRKQKEVLQKIFDYIPIMVTFYDAEGKLKLANQEWERTQGWSLREIEEQKADILAELYPDALYRCTVLKTVAEADGHWRDFTSTTRDGKKIDVSWAVVRLSDQTTVCIGKNITERKRTEAERNQLMRRLITAQEDERRYISRELHDNMGQYLAALILGLESLGAVSQLPLRAHDELVYLKDVTKQFEQAVHRFTLDLRPTALDDLGLQVALAASVDDWARRCQYTVSADFHCSGFDDRQQRLLPEIEAALYRVVQEALTNVLRHAEASNVSVILERQPDDVRLIVEDDGKGFDVDALMRVPVANRRLGLTGMRERVELVGGTLEVDSGAGTTIVVNIPLAQPEL